LLTFHFISGNEVFQNVLAASALCAARPDRNLVLDCQPLINLPVQNVRRVMLVLRNDPPPLSFWTMVP